MKIITIATLFTIICFSHVLAAGNEQSGQSGTRQRILSKGTSRLKSRIHAWLTSKTKGSSVRPYKPIPHLGRTTQARPYNAIFPQGRTTQARPYNAIFPQGRTTQARPYNAIFPQGRTTQARPYNAIFPQGRTTQARTYNAIFPQGRTTQARPVFDRRNHTTQRSSGNRFKVPSFDRGKVTLDPIWSGHPATPTASQNYSPSSAWRNRQMGVHSTESRQFGVTAGQTKFTDGRRFVTFGHFKKTDHMLGSTQNRMNTTGHPKDTTGHRMDTSRHPVDTTGHRMDTSGHPVDTTGHRMDTSRHPVDTTGHRMDTSRHPVDTTGHRMDRSRHPVDTTSHSMDTSGHPVDTTGYLSGHQTDTTRHHLETIEHLPETGHHMGSTGHASEYQADTTRHRVDSTTHRIITTTSGQRTTTARHNVGYKESTEGKNSIPTAEHASTHMPTNSDVEFKHGAVDCDIFICDDGTITVGVALVCDGIRNCFDGSDEAMSDGINCHSSKVKCSTGVCFSANNSKASSNKCGPVRVRECNAVSEFSCSTRKECIPIHHRCDGLRNCKDGTDEVSCPCNGSSCDDDDLTQKVLSCDTFICDNGEVATGTALVCDGMPDCIDRSDEQISDGGICIRSKTVCPSGVCINKNSSVNSADKCDSDFVQKCRDDYFFSCDLGQKCLAVSERCDGIRNCDDGTDESVCPCQGLSCTDGGLTPMFTSCGTFICDDGEIARGIALVCDGIQDCSDGSDESNSDGVSCFSSKTQCSTGICISKNNSNASSYNCEPAHTSDCDANTQFSCDTGENCIPISERCDGVRNCQDGTDELSCPCNGSSCDDDGFIRSITKCDTFICDNGDIAFGTALVCDGVQDCNDGSDEAISYGSECFSSKALCPTGVCVGTSNTSPDIHKCGSTNIPECNADHQFSCDMRKKCILNSERCNGVRDCDDGSDEALCQCPGFTCDNGQCVAVTAPCDSVTDCEDASDESLARCFNNSSPRFCGGVFASEPFHCDDGTCVEKSSKCDGRNDCLDGSDEAMCSACAPPNFVCDNGRCVAAYLKCNGANDCGDASDEELCDDENYIFGSNYGTILAYSFIGLGAFIILLVVLVGIVYCSRKGKRGKKQRSIEYVLAPPPYERSVNNKQRDLCFVNPISELTASN